MFLLWPVDVDMSAGVYNCVLGCNKGYSTFCTRYVLIHVFFMRVPSSCSRIFFSLTPGNEDRAGP